MRIHWTLGPLGPMVLVLLLACWLGARSLNAQPLWGDEWDSIRDARGFEKDPFSLPAIWQHVAETIPDHTPGYFLILNLWGRVVGWQPPALRALSLFAGLLTIALTCRLGDDLGSRLTGLSASAILATSAFFVYFADEMRVYTIVAMVSVFTVWAYSYVLREIHSRWGWIALFVGVVGTLYAQYLGVIVLAGLASWHLVFVPKTKHWWKITGVMIGGALTFVPWVTVMIEGIRFQKANSAIGNRGLSIFQSLSSFAWMFSNGMVLLMLGLTIAAVVAVWIRKTTPQLRLLVVVAIMSLVSLLVVTQIIPMMSAGRLRYLIPLWPLFALVVGAGIAALWRWRPIGAGVLILWMFAGLWSTLFVDFTHGLDGADVNYPVHRIAYIISTHVLPGDLVVNYLPDGLYTFKKGTLRYYYQALLNPPVDFALSMAEEDRQVQENEQRDLLRDMQTHERVWIGYPKDQVPSTLAAFEARVLATFQRCGQFADPYVRVDLYIRAEQVCPTDTVS